MSEPALIRRELALKHGATIVIDPLNAPSVPAAVLAATENIGVHVAFDAAGTQAGLDGALASVRPHGTFVVVAIWSKKPTVDTNLILSREINFTGVFLQPAIRSVSDVWGRREQRIRWSSS